MARKAVAFSDSHNVAPSKTTNAGVHVRKTLSAVPVHLPVCLWAATQSLGAGAGVLAVCQLLYTVIFNKYTYAGSRRLKLNVSLLLATGLICTVGALPVAAVLVLFGAHVTSQITETLLLSLHIAFLCAPSVYGMINHKSDYFLKYVLGTFIGCWLSAVVIPLDWDREWQQWPTPVVFGAYLGSILVYTVGAFF